MIVKSPILTFYLAGTILLGILSSSFPFGVGKSIQLVEAQAGSNLDAEAAMQEAYEALVATGINGIPGRLSSTGEGFAQTYHDSSGKILFIILWTINTGAHTVQGPIMQLYKSEGWHLSQLGYPISDEQDLGGVPNGRYTQFENGVIAMQSGKNVQVFPTVEEAVKGLAGGQGVSMPPSTGDGQGQGPSAKQGIAIVHKEKRFEVTFYAVNSVQCHDIDCTNDQVPDGDCSKFDLYSSINGKMSVLMSSACMPGGLAYRDNPTKWYTLSPSLVNKFSDLPVNEVLFNNVQANQLGPFTVTVAVPDNGHFIIQTGGRERDRAGDGDPSPYFDLVKSANSKMQDYIRNEYIPSHPNIVSQKGNIDYDMAYYDIVTGAELMSKIANNPGAAAAEFGNEAKNLLPELSGLSNEEVGKYLAGVDIVQNVIQNPEQAVNKYGQEAIKTAISEVVDQIPGPVGSFVSALDVNRLVNDPGGYVKDTAKDLAIEVAIAYGAQSIPGLGQAYAIGYALYKAFSFLSGANPDDGIGIIHETCSAQNNFCVGTHKYLSKFNGVDSDSAGDFWMAINVKEI